MGESKLWTSRKKVVWLINIRQQVVWLVNVEPPLTSFSLSKEVTKNESHQNRLSYHNEPCPCQSTFLFARLSTFCAGTTRVVWMTCAADSILFICWLCVPEIIIYSIYWIILHIWALFACRIDIQNILNIQNLPPTNSWWYTYTDSKNLILVFVSYHGNWKIYVQVQLVNEFTAHN